MKTNRSFSAKRLLSLLLVFAMIVGILPTVAFAAEKPVQVMGLDGLRYYDTLAEAIADAKNKDDITLLEDMEGPGLFMERVTMGTEKHITIWLDGHTYTCTGPAVGSSRTQTQALHLEENNHVVIRDGIITCTADSGVKMLVQNYANLELFNVTLDGRNLPGTGRYVLSNNSGFAYIHGNSNIYAKPGDVAFDSCEYGSYLTPKVRFFPDFSGEVVGDVEVTGGELLVFGGSVGTFDGEIKTGANYNVGDITLGGGFYSQEIPDEMIPDDCDAMVKTHDGKYGPAKSAEIELIAGTVDESAFAEKLEELKAEYAGAAYLGAFDVDAKIGTNVYAGAKLPSARTFVTKAFTKLDKNSTYIARHWNGESFDEEEIDATVKGLNGLSITTDDFSPFVVFTDATVLCDVKFVLDGEQIKYEPVISGKYATPPTVIVPEGKTFDGWYTASDYSGTPFAFATSITADQTFYARLASDIVTITEPASVPTGITYAWTGDADADTAAENRQVTKGTLQSFTVTLDGSYDPASLVVKKDGVALSATKIDGNEYTYQFKATEDHVLTIGEPAKYQYTVTMPSVNGVTTKFTVPASSDKVVSVEKGENVSYTITAGNGVVITAVYENGVQKTYSENGVKSYNGTISTIDADVAVTIDAADAVFYTVNYIVDNANYANFQQVEEGTDLTLLEEPVKEGYEFDGWYTTAAYTGAKAVSPVTVTKNTEFYGKFDAKTYQISYDKNTAEEVTNMPAAPTAKPYDKAVALSDKVPVCTGYVFKGWALSADGPAVYNPGDTFSTAISEATTLYAVWEKNTYTVTLPTGTGYSISTAQSTTVEYGDSFTFTVTVDRSYSSTIPTVTATTTEATPVTTDLTPAALAASEEDGSRVYTITISDIKADQIVSITVAKNQTYTVTFKTVTDDATPKIAVYQTQEVEDTYCAMQPADPAIEGYTFEGWYSDQACTDGNEYDFAAPVTAATTVYGKMAAIKPVVTIPAAGTVTGAGVAFVDTDALAATTETHEHTYKDDCKFTVTVQEGYDASAMQVGANGTALAPIAINGNVYTYVVSGVTEDTTVTVVGIVRKTVTITYMSNARDDVSGMPAPQVVNYYVAALTDNDKITDQEPVRTGYEFLGWATDSEATAAEYVAGDAADFTADTTLYAVWKATKTEIALKVINTIDDTAATLEEYEDEMVTLKATITTSDPNVKITNGMVNFYQNNKLIGSVEVNGKGIVVFEAKTSEYAVDGSAKDEYVAEYQADNDEGFSNSMSGVVKVVVRSTAITWELDSSNEMVADANVLMIKDDGGNTVDQMEADTAYTLNLPMVYELGRDALTVDTNYTVTWQYKDANGTWVNYGTTTGNTVSIQPEYSKYSFRALVYPVGEPTSHYTKAAAYDGAALDGYGKFLETEPTKAVEEQEVTVTVTASDEISSTTAVDVYQLNEITLTAVVEPTNADSTKQPSGTVTFYYQVGTGDVVELDSAELKNESGKMTAKITTCDLPVADTANTKQDVTVIAVYNGDKTFKKSNTFDAAAKTLADTVAAEAKTDVTVYSSVIFTDGTVENKAPGASVAGAISIRVSDGKLAANETNVSLQLSDVYTLDHAEGDIAKLTFGTDYTVQWQKLSNAAAYTDFGAADTPWEDISGATGTTCAIVVEQSAAYRAVVTAQDTPIAKGSYTSVDQDIDGRVTYYSNVLIADAGSATVTVNVNTSNTSDGYEGIVEGEKVTISTFVAGATNSTPISKITVTITDNGGSEVFKAEEDDVNGYTSFDWTDTKNPGVYELKVVSVPSNGYDPTTITRKLIVRDADYSFTVSDATKTYNGKAQGLSAVTGDMCDQFRDLADKCVVVYYYDEAGNQVEPSDAGTYKAVVRLQESAYWTEQVVDTYTFTIEARKVSVVDLVAQAKVYDGTTDANILEIVLGDAAVDTATGLPTDDTGVLNGDSIYAVGTAYTSSANAGTVSLKVRNVELKGDDAANYELDDASYTEDFNIMRNQLKGDIADATYAYGTKEVPADDIIVIDQQGSDFTDYDVTYYYHNGDGVEKVDGLDAKGLYTVIVTPKDTANYKGGAAQKIYVAQTAVDAAPVAPESATIAFSNTVELYGEASGIVATASNGTVSAITYNGSAAVPTNAGRYVVKATVTNGSVTDTAYGIYTIVKADPELTLTASDADYNSAQQTGSPVLTDATADYYTYTGGTIQGVSYTAPTEVGTYVVTAHVNETANYTAHEVSATFEIKPVVLTVKADSWRRHQYGSYPDMTATFSGLASGGAAADTSLRDVQIQPEFVFDNYSNAGMDQVGKDYTITPVAALARNYTVVYENGKMVVTAIDGNLELAIHGMISNGNGDKSIAYYGDVIQLYAYGSQKADVINNSSVLTWTVTGPASIDAEGVLTITGVGTVEVTLQRGEGRQAISTTMTIEAKPQEVMVVVPTVDKVFSAAAQSYDGTVSTLNAMLVDAGAATAVAAGDSRTNIGSQITTYRVTATNFCSEAYGGLYTINQKDVYVYPSNSISPVVYGDACTLDNTRYGVDGKVGGAGVFIYGDATVESIREAYINLDVTTGANQNFTYEVLVGGSENLNYNVHYKTASATAELNTANTVRVNGKPLTVKTGVYDGTVGQTAGSLNPAGEYPVEGEEVDASAAFNQATTRMYGEPNQVMAYMLETLVDGDSEADLAVLVDWLVTYEFDIAGHASVQYLDKATQLLTSATPNYQTTYGTEYASTIATKGQQIVSSEANIDLVNYAETYNLGTQDIYQRPVKLISTVDAAHSDLYKLVSAAEIESMLKVNITVDKVGGEGGLAMLLNHTINDLDLKFSYRGYEIASSTWVTLTDFSDLSAYSKLEVTVKVGNPDYYAEPLVIEFTVSPTYYKLLFTSKGRTSATVQMKEYNPVSDKFDNTKLPGDTVGATSSAVTVLIYKAVPGKTSYSDYKDSETPVVNKLMTLSNDDGRYTVSYPTLPAASYKMFVIAAGYILIDNT